jgi:nucleoside 2-deoxyribosyltransferase
MRIYVAGPLFTPYHRDNIAQHVADLRALGHECFVPQEQEHNSDRSASLPAQVFSVDLAGLRWADAMIAHLDDPDVSSGVACEMGIFYELVQQQPGKKGILGILTDERSYRRSNSNVGESLNFFTMGCIEKIGRVYPSWEALLGHLAEWQAQLASGGSSR